MRHGSLLLILCMLAACGGGAPDDPQVVDLQLQAALDAAGPDGIEAVIDANLRPKVAEAAARMEQIIQNPELPTAAKHNLLTPILREVAPLIERKAMALLIALDGRDLGPHAEDIRQLLYMARALGQGARDAAQIPPYWDRFGHIPREHVDDFAPELPDAVADKYWLLYHWSEIIGGYYDDTDYAWVFADSGRTSFLEQEAGASGIEQIADEWRVPTEVWDDPELSVNQKLMAAKYTMWQNPDWGGGQHYIDEWWSWEAGYKEEDNALFLGNTMAALAAQYELTRDARTLVRLQAQLRAFEYYDTLTVDDPDPLAQEPPDGRITRGTKTRNLYLEDEMNIFDIEFTGGQVIFHHNNSWPDHFTGRERKNVSRDQYYGLFLGYYTLWQVLTALPDRTEAEQQLLDDLVAHTTLITDYVFGQSNLHWDWGWEYSFYALLEGSCANPPNFTFMMFFGHVGLEEMTGQSFTKFDTLHDLGMQIFAFGRSLGKVWLSRKLFEPSQTGLTALNQYLSAFYMSDISPQDWLFLWPPEVIARTSEGQRKLWRRVVAAFYRKYGVLGSEPYRQVAEETYDAAFNPRPTVQIMYNRTVNGYAYLDAAGPGTEDFLLPFAMLASRAANRDELATKLAQRYQDLINDSSIDFTDTDLIY